MKILFIGIAGPEMILILIFYIIPSIVALTLKKKNSIYIILLNLVLGWTVLGWIGALVWAIASPKNGDVNPKD